MTLAPGSSALNQAGTASECWWWVLEIVEERDLFSVGRMGSGGEGLPACWGVDMWETSVIIGRVPGEE